MMKKKIGEHEHTVGLGAIQVGQCVRYVSGDHFEGPTQPVEFLAGNRGHAALPVHQDHAD